MKVKALKNHDNGYGDKYQKSAGDTYKIPGHAARPLIKLGMIEEVKAESEASRASPQDEKPMAKRSAKSSGDPK